MSMAPELSAAYIASITEEELRAAGYEIRSFYYPGEGDTFGIYINGAYFLTLHTKDAAWLFAREHYAPRKQLAEAQARISALEALVREAYEARSTFDYIVKPGVQLGYVMNIDWRERATKLLEVGE